MGTKHPSPVKLPSHPWGLEYRHHDERGMVGRETHADSTRLRLGPIRLLGRGFATAIGRG